ncbi:MAG: copper resistance protein CopC [Friedmanniella sp.]
MLLLGGGLAATVAPAAHAADNELVATEPGIRAELDRPPGFVTMAFSEPVDPSLAKMLVLDARGANVTTGELIVEGTNMSSQLVDGLPRGTYTVSYRLARSDGEPQGGTFQFSYGSGTFTAAADRTWSGSRQQPEVLKNPDPNAVSPSPTRTSASSPHPTPTRPSRPGPSAAPSSSEPSSSSPLPTATGTPGGASPGGGATPLLVFAGALALALLAAAGGTVLTRRGRDGSDHR